MVFQIVNQSPVVASESAFWSPQSPPRARKSTPNASSLRLNPNSLLPSRPSRRPLTPDQARICLSRAEFLDLDDQALIFAMYRDGLSSRHLAIAALARTSNTSPKQIRPADYTRELSTTARSIRRRAHRLVAHLLSPIFTFILKHTHHVSTHDPQPTWSTTRTRIAEHCFLRAHSQRHTARALNLSIHHIRREVLAIRALFEQERRPQ